MENEKTLISIEAVKQFVQGNIISLIAAFCYIYVTVVSIESQR